MTMILLIFMKKEERLYDMIFLIANILLIIGIAIR